MMFYILLLLIIKIVALANGFQTSGLLHLNNQNIERSNKVSCKSHFVLHERKRLAGLPISPEIDPEDIIIRYMYDGMAISNGRICLLPLEENTSTISGLQISDALKMDGVDLDIFYPAVYESKLSQGGWFPLEKDGVDRELEFPIPSKNDVEECSNDEKPTNRIDVKLFRRPLQQDDEEVLRKEWLSKTSAYDKGALLAESMSKPSGKLSPELGYFGVGIVNGKTKENVGTLLRSAYQLGVSFLFTVGQRYKTQSADTVKAHTRVPLFEFEDYESFLKFSPRNAKLVAIEMGGTPLKDFKHPQNCIYILGSEDAGVPKSILQSCHEIVSLDCENYASYNVAVAGSIVLYDRLQKKNDAAQMK